MLARRGGKVSAYATHHAVDVRDCDDDFPCVMRRMPRQYARMTTCVRNNQVTARSIGDRSVAESPSK